MNVRHLNPAPQQPSRTVLVGARGFVGAATRRKLEERGWLLLPLTSDDVNLFDGSAASGSNRCCARTTRSSCWLR